VLALEGRITIASLKKKESLAGCFSVRSYGMSVWITAATHWAWHMFLAESQKRIP